MLYCLLSKVLRFVEIFASWQVDLEMVLLICTDANEPWKLNTVSVSETNCCNQPKSLSGIETLVEELSLFCNIYHVAINLNPYQGLKLYCPIASGVNFCQVAINLNPYQGLKLVGTDSQMIHDLVAINLNPYQGLKLWYFPNPSSFSSLQST